MTPRRESRLILLTAFAGLFSAAAFAAHTWGWNPTAVHAWALAVRNADTVGGSVWALKNCFPWLPTVTLWPFTLLTWTRSPLAPLAVSSFSVAVLIALGWWRLRERGFSPWNAAVILALLLGNPLILGVAISGNFRATVLVLWFVHCAAAKQARDVEDARSFLTLSGVAGMVWYCDLKFALLLVPFIPLCHLIIPKRVREASPSAGYLVLLFPSVIALGSLFWVAYVMPGQGLVVRWWEFRPLGVETVLLCLGALATGVATFLVKGPDVLYALLGSVVISAAYLQAALAAHPDPLFFVALLVPTVLLWAESAKSRVPLGIAAALLWCLPSGLPTERFEHDREMGMWLAQHRGSSVLADDEAMGEALAFSGSASNLVLPGTPEYSRVTAKESPGTEFVLLRGRVAARYGERISGYAAIGKFGVLQRVQETQELANTY